MNEAKAQNMGETTSQVFSGEYKSETTREMYAETADFFANEIRKRLKNDKKYTLLDIGSFQGELMTDLINKLPEYDFDTIAVDINEQALQNNDAVKKVVSDIETLPFADKSVNLAIMRYVLQWNNALKQRQILTETARTIKEFALIEHVGSDISDTEEWRGRFDTLLNGSEIPKLKRGDHYFSSRDDIEEWMNQSDIRYERIRDRKIENASSVFIERYGLDTEESQKVKNTLGDKDFFRQTDWIIYPKN